MSRRLVVALLAVALGVGIARLWRGGGAREGVEYPPATVRPAAVVTSVPATPAISESPPAKSGEAAAAAEPELDRITVVDALGAPGGTIEGDLALLVTLFEDWRSFFPGDGNPWGSNREITAALLGKNSRHLVFVAKDHRALNADGELCDRWGTPFRFHALAADRMEIRSAGPDKKFGTADDAGVTPP